MKKQCAHKLPSRRCPKLHSNGLEAKTKRSGQKESQLTEGGEKRKSGREKRRKMAGAVGLRKTMAHQITANNKQTASRTRLGRQLPRPSTELCIVVVRFLFQSATRRIRNLLPCVCDCE